ncbi:hypothetical protein F5X68DRAFT_279913 [Plectosphaerella plurivora]|uniref:Uncharacterized protein n=1 Tax=Plectosphaerella plurivora TaxID=936078 RepID=A0A9P9A3A6_9PEZI|nr:hypothetical protein F5X68DRAFT_279913 [Plectosphaerella plurivora]
MEQTNCTALRSMKGFDEYIELLRNETDFELSRLEPCRSDVCDAVWGGGNPDISGIGVSVGYIVEIVLGATLVLLSMLLNRKQGRRWEAWDRVVRQGLRAFFDSALYFAISIEIAIIVLLVNKDFGISTDGFGAGDAQVALAISSLCILPLMHPLSLLRERDSDETAARSKEGRKRSHEETYVHRDNLMLLLFSLLAVIFFYPFVSQGMHNLGPARVGDGKVATTTEWRQIRRLCFPSPARLTASELVLLKVTEMTSSLIIYLFAAWQLFTAVSRKMEADDRQLGDDRRVTAILVKVRKFAQAHTRRAFFQVGLVMVPSTLAGILLYCVFRMRHVQKQMIEGMGARYQGNDWGFGQIMAIVIFAPVVTEMSFAAWEGGRREATVVEDS